MDCKFLPSELGPSSGILSLYTNEEDCNSGTVVFDPSATLEISGSAPLFAEPARSLPPPDAFSEAVNDEYLRLWQSNCPLYGEGTTAVLGGWHFPWPDGDWEDLREKQLVLWTIEDSEPWVEVWREQSGYRVMQRVT